MNIGKSFIRVDGFDKSTGRALYTDDLTPQNALVAKVVRSTIANGLVKSFDLDEAIKVSGVTKIFTCFDVPDIKFPTAGHPWSTDKNHQDIADRKLLNQRVRVYGDDIAVVVADNIINANKAAKLIKVTYDEYKPMVTVDEALSNTSEPIHQEYPNNILKQTKYQVGETTFDESVKNEDVTIIEDEFETQIVQHCHIEPVVSFAYMEKGRIIVVAATQIPHIARRVIGQALGIPWGKVRVIKPYIGGGFGNRQDVLYEPLNAWLTYMLGGKAIKLELTREETMASTRVRHGIKFKIKTAIRPNGKFVARTLKSFSNQGGYASHGHSIVANANNAFRMLYQDEKSLEAEALTIFTNTSTGGAMRGYGIPQIQFAAESHIDDLAKKIEMDPLEVRKLNCMKLGYVDPFTKITCHSSGLLECMEKGREFIKWDQKRKEYENQTGDIRKGVGMAIFCYKTGVYPISLETASCRIVLNQDGSIQLQVGATEIGQGSDTVFSQMVSDTIGISIDKVNLVSTQDTDVTPFDTGAYASRQTYVTGKAVKQTALLFKEKVIQYAAEFLKLEPDSLEIKENNIVDKITSSVVISMEDISMEAFYSLTNSNHITAESTHHCTDNSYSFGACFVEVSVDIPVGKIDILNIVNVHDSGTLMNPKLAEAQVHGGMSMGLGYALGEQLLFDSNAKPLNDNLLDYKLPTSMDTPNLNVLFVETVDPSGPYGNKSLGEPPAIPVAPAIRNAVLHATGVAINSIPLNPQKLVENFTSAGLIK